jgi:dsDNA-specific endonuclease/ATPase MutS2
VLGWLRRWLAARAARTPAAGSGERGETADGSDGDGDGDGDRDRDPSALADELDLHTFLPRECADVVEEYVRAAQEAGLPTVRIIHGKGKGTLRRTVHAVLARHPAVRSYQLAEAHRGSWGATLVELNPP